MKFISICLFLFLLNGSAFSTCTEVNFYRFNNIQSTNVTYLFHNGVPLAQVEMGQRFQLQLCEPGEHTFDVRPSPDGFSMAKELVTNEGGKVYLKISVAVGVDLPGIKRMDTQKGVSDWGKTSKFIGAAQLLNSPGGVHEPGGGPISTGGDPVQIGSEFVIQNFRFQVTNLIKSGDAFRIEYKITNLTGEDRKIWMNPGNTYFYDEHGQIYFAREICVGNQCCPVFAKAARQQVQDRWDTSTSGVGNKLPSGIPISSYIEFGNIRRNATRFVRGNVLVAAGEQYHNGVDLVHGTITFPKLVDENDPTRRTYGDQATKLVHARRVGQHLQLQFRHENLGAEPYELRVTNAKLYDDLGQEYDGRNISYGSTTEVQQLPYSTGRRYTVIPRQSTDFYLTIENFADRAASVARATLNFKDFQLHWENIPVTGGASSAIGSRRTSQNSSATSSDYVEFRQFDRRARSGESVRGARIILEDIHFFTGSDQLQSSSYPQLDELAALLEARPELRLEISGHTDATGGETPNMLLSQQRADAIRYYLIKRGISPESTTSVGYGPNRPIAENSSATGRQRNRRVELRVSAD